MLAGIRFFNWSKNSSWFSILFIQKCQCMGSWITNKWFICILRKIYRQISTFCVRLFFGKYLNRLVVRPYPLPKILSTNCWSSFSSAGNSINEMQLSWAYSTSTVKPHVNGTNLNYRLDKLFYPILSAKQAAKQQSEFFPRLAIKRGVCTP